MQPIRPLPQILPEDEAKTGKRGPHVDEGRCREPANTWSQLFLKAALPSDFSVMRVNQLLSGLGSPSTKTETSPPPSLAAFCKCLQKCFSMEADGGFCAEGVTRAPPLPRAL